MALLRHYSGFNITVEKHHKSLFKKRSLPLRNKLKNQGNLVYSVQQRAICLQNFVEKITAASISTNPYTEFFRFQLQELESTIFKRELKN